MIVVDSHARIADLSFTFCDIIQGKSRSSTKLLMDAILGSAVQPYMNTFGLRLWP